METRVRQTEGLELFQWRNWDDPGQMRRVSEPAPLDYCGERHGGNAESEAAFDGLAESGEIERQEARVLALVAESGAAGITCKEAAVELGTHPNNISGRFTALHAKHEIRRQEADGRVWRRDGAAVWILNRS